MFVTSISVCVDLAYSAGLQKTNLQLRRTGRNDYIGLKLINKPSGNGGAALSRACFSHGAQLAPFPTDASLAPFTGTWAAEDEAVLPTLFDPSACQVRSCSPIGLGMHI